jgi:beta-1,4-mannosyltransferase
MIKIGFLPYSNNENKYVSIMIRILEGIDGVKVVPFDILSFILFKPNAWRVNAVWINWFENTKGFLNLMIKTLMLLIFKVLGKKIIYVLHNKRTHNEGLTNAFTLFRHFIFKVSDVIVTHCRSSIDEIPKKYQFKIINIPHPHYAEMYGELKENEGFEKSLKLLMIGQLKPYKNIEMLIQVISTFSKDEVHLTIAGKPINSSFQKKIEELSQGHSIRLELNFIEDHLFNELLGTCDLVVLPYNLESSLNSGTAIMAFSYGKSVICPKIGTLLEFQDKYFFSYHYSTTQEHQEELTKAVKSAICLKRKKPYVFNEWGNLMRKQVLSMNSPEIIQSLIQREIISKLSR